MDSEWWLEQVAWFVTDSEKLIETFIKLLDGTFHFNFLPKSVIFIEYFNYRNKTKYKLRERRRIEGTKKYKERKKKKKRNI